MVREKHDVSMSLGLVALRGERKVSRTSLIQGIAESHETIIYPSMAPRLYIQYSIIIQIHYILYL